MVLYYHVLIVGDSRMRYLQKFLNYTSLNIYFTEVTLLGANMRRIMYETLEIVRSSRPYHLIIIAGGINDMLSSIATPPGTSRGWLQTW